MNRREERGLKLALFPVHTQEAHLSWFLSWPILGVIYLAHNQK